MSFSMPDFAAKVCGMKTANTSIQFSENATNQPNEKTVILPSFYRYKYQFANSEGLVIDCYLEHEEAEPQSHDSPGHRESVELVYALVNGVDISDVLSDDVADLIEEEALQSMAMDKWNGDYDKGEARAQDLEEV